MICLDKNPIIVFFFPNSRILHKTLLLNTTQKILHTIKDFVPENTTFKHKNKGCFMKSQIFDKTADLVLDNTIKH